MHSDTISSPILLTFKQAAEILGASENKVRSLVRNKQLTAVLVGKRLMVPRDAIPRFVEENTRRATPSAVPKKVTFQFKKLAAG